MSRTTNDLSGYRPLEQTLVTTYVNDAGEIQEYQEPVRLTKRRPVRTDGNNGKNLRQLSGSKWGRLYDDAHPRLEQCSAATVRFFVRLTSITKPDAPIHLAGNDLTERLGMTRQAAQRAIASLLDVGLLIKIKRGWYYINPLAYWRGSDHARERLLKELRDAGALPAPTTPKEGQE